MEQWEINRHHYGIYKPMASLPTVVCTAILFNHLLVKSTIVCISNDAHILYNYFSGQNWRCFGRSLVNVVRLLTGLENISPIVIEIVWQCSLVTYITMNDSFTQLFTYMFN